MVRLTDCLGMTKAVDCSDFIHQIGKVPVPLKLGKLLMPKT